MHVNALILNRPSHRPRQSQRSHIKWVRCGRKTDSGFLSALRVVSSGKYTHLTEVTADTHYINQHNDNQWRPLHFFVSQWSWVGSLASSVLVVEVWAGLHVGGVELFSDMKPHLVKTLPSEFSCCCLISEFNSKHRTQTQIKLYQLPEGGRGSWIQWCIEDIWERAYSSFCEEWTCHLIHTNKNRKYYPQLIFKPAAWHLSNTWREQQKDYLNLQLIIILISTWH